MKNKYLITLWVDWYGYESLMTKFSIECETNNLKDAKLALDRIAREIVNNGLKEFDDFAIMKVPSERKSILEDVNKNNTVIRKERRKIGDGGKYNAVYYDFDLIKVPYNARVDENLFNLQNCEKEVKSFFKYSYGQSQETRSGKRFSGLKELAKLKLILGGIDQKKSFDTYLDVSTQKKK